MNKRAVFPKTLSLWIIPGLCFALLAFLTLRYFIAVPLIDQWELVPLLQKMYQGQLEPSDLWAQHNEHRLLFPRLIMLGLASLSHWNLRWELMTSLLFAVAILGVAGLQLRQTAHRVEDPTILRLFPIASIIVFSLRQSENWMWGWQLQIFLNVLAVVSGITLLTWGTLTWGRLMAAVFCGVVATYSFANGMLFWLVGGYALWAHPREKAFKAQFAAWCACALLIGVSYFHGYVKPSDSPPMLDALRHPGQSAAYFLSYIGAFISLKDTPWIGVPLGILGLALLGQSWRRLRQTAHFPPDALTPYLAYALYVILSAAVSSVGRSELGAKQAMSSRYLTISELFWLATLTLGYLAVRQHEAAQTTRKVGHWAQRVLILAGLVFAVNSLKNVRAFRARYQDVQEVERQMRQGDYAAGAKLYPLPHVVEERAPFLRQHRLALYR